MNTSTILPILYAIFMSAFVFGQNNLDTKEINLTLKKGKIQYTLDNEVLHTNQQIFEVLKSSEKLNAVKYGKRYKRRSVFAEITGGIGLGFVGIWIINEVANPEFHSTNPEDRTWKFIAVGTSLSFSITGLLLNKSAKRQLHKGIEEFNKY